MILGEYKVFFQHVFPENPVNLIMYVYVQHFENLSSSYRGMAFWLLFCIA